MCVMEMTDLNLTGRRVLIREDLNVPVKDGRVTSAARLRASLPNIQFALKAGALEAGMSISFFVKGFKPLRAAR